MNRELVELLHSYAGSEATYPCISKITGVVADSRSIQPGNIFVACKGEYADGHHFIRDAVERGAVVVVGIEPMGDRCPVPYFQVADSRKELAHLSAAFYEYPASKMTIIGVTGTDGKTTTTNLIYGVLKTVGYKTGMISTVNAIIDDQVIDTGFHVTTPDAPSIQSYLEQMSSCGIQYVVLEATSHGLDQSRVESCEFDFGVFTNITHEHLDYHGNFENYRAAKGKLVSYLKETKVKPFFSKRLAVFNQDDDSIGYLSGLASDQHVDYWTYGLSSKADCFTTSIEYVREGMHFNVVSSKGQFDIQLPMTGLYNVSNCLAMVTTTIEGLNLPVEAVQEGCISFKGIPGRMERIDLGQDFIAMVDFAHTPNALRRSLETARELTHGKLIAVFGSAGLRDQAKRRMMAEISICAADMTIMTAEDPRTESLDKILTEMADGAVSRGGVEEVNFYLIPDRRAAIRKAIQIAQPGDTVITCGKGHEQSMCFGKIEYAWDDRTAMRAALCEKLKISGPEMPFLPT